MKSKWREDKECGQCGDVVVETLSRGGFGMAAWECLAAIRYDVR
jgi:hypothetical protein